MVNLGNVEVITKCNSSKTANITLVLHLER